MRQKETILGLFAAIAFQLIFVTIWLTGYDGVFERSNQLQVGIINEDSMIGQQINDELVANGTFSFIPLTTLEAATEQLKDGQLSMIIHLPAKLTEQIQANKQPTIDYYMNQSVPSLEKQMMDHAATIIHEQINGDIKTVIQQQLNIQSEPNLLMANKINTSDQTAFVYTMVPLLIILASFIGAMLISQHLQFTQAKLRHNHSIWSLFIVRQIINLLAAITISLLTISLMYAFQIEVDSSFFNVWIFQALLMFSFLMLSQIFVIAFGNIGMVCNIALVALQLVSSGAIVPKKLLPTFYEAIGSYLPATYGVSGYFRFLYGGESVAADVSVLFIMTSVCIVIAISIVAVQSVLQKRAPQAITA